MGNGMCSKEPCLEQAASSVLRGVVMHVLQWVQASCQQIPCVVQTKQRPKQMSSLFHCGHSRNKSSTNSTSTSSSCCGSSHYTTPWITAMSDSDVAGRRCKFWMTRM